MSQGQNVVLRLPNNKINNQAGRLGLYLLLKWYYVYYLESTFNKRTIHYIFLKESYIFIHIFLTKSRTKLSSTRFCSGDATSASSVTGRQHLRLVFFWIWCLWSSSDQPARDDVTPLHVAQELIHPDIKAGQKNMLGMCSSVYNPNKFANRHNMNLLQ